MTLDSIETRTQVRVVQTSNGNLGDQIVIGDEVQSPEAFAGFFQNLRQVLVPLIRANAQSFEPSVGEGPAWAFDVRSQNNFPTAAGLASSASGLAALTGACVASLLRPEFRTPWERALVDQEKSLQEKRTEPLTADSEFRELGRELPGFPGLPGLLSLSALARYGSGSASRSVFGGFTLFPQGSPVAHPLESADFWPEARIILVPLSSARKPVSSRIAMNRTRDTSPYYEAWVNDAPKVAVEAQEALKKRDEEKLGTLMINSYLRMFSTMFAAQPPVVYWLPESLVVIRLAAELRSKGLPVWETMDAGPQVKLFTLSSSVPEILRAVEQALPSVVPVVSGPGNGLQWVKESTL